MQVVPLLPLLGLTLIGPSLQKGPGPLQIRLADKSSAYEGRVEVRRGDGDPWGSVCNFFWDRLDGIVACRQLNPNWVFVKDYRVDGYGGGGPFFLSQVGCRGHETNLGQCDSIYGAYADHNCRYAIRHTRIKCTPYQAYLRPLKGPTDNARFGSMAIYRKATQDWIDVCDDHWDDNDAKVLCRHLGFVSGRALCCSALSQHLQWRSLVTATNMSCTGSEPSLQNCSHSESSQSCVGHLASAICYTTPLNNVDNMFGVRLSSGGTYYGRVEVRRFGVWGSVAAHDTWNNSAASVFCKQVVGFSGGVPLRTEGSSPAAGVVWVTRLNCSGTEGSVEQCVVPPWGSGATALASQHVLCYDKSAPEVVLEGGGSPSRGRVTLRVDGVSHSVCDNDWSDVDANVVCKSLGYPAGLALQGSYYGPGSGLVALNKVSCSGGERSLLDCGHQGWLNSNADCDTHNKDASVYCWEKGPFVLEGGDGNKGSLKVLLPGTSRYSYVCGTGFDDADATVACREMGFQHGKALAKGSFGTAFAFSFVWKNLTCLGNESSLFDCQNSGSCSAWSDNTNYAAVHCYNGSLNAGESVELAGGGVSVATSTGRVSVSVDGLRGSVCPIGWDDQDASVVCRQLGFAGGAALYYGTQNAGPFLLADVQCLGNESSLFHCRSTKGALCKRMGSFGQVTAGAVCFSSTAPAPQFRLVGGTSARDGRVEVDYLGLSGSVCLVNGIDGGVEASLVCQALGFTAGKKKSVPAGTGRVSLASVHCGSTHSISQDSLFLCRNTGFFPDVSGCADDQFDLGVTCLDEVDVDPLVKQTADAVWGVARWYINDKWHYVCGDYFDDENAKVFCHKLGYTHYSPLPVGIVKEITGYDVPEFLPINCTGAESSPKDCPVQTEKCQTRANSNYGSVVCSKRHISTVLKAVEPEKQPGFAVVQMYGLKSSICIDDWDSSDALVYCRSLGYRYGQAFGPTEEAAKPPSDAGFIYNLACKGNESCISRCAFTTTFQSSCSGSARVFCYDHPRDFQVRLTGGKTESEGVVEIGFKGQWGSVCDDYLLNWTPQDALVACRSVGWSQGVPVNGGNFVSVVNMSLTVFPKCDGTEDNIVRCPSLSFNNHDFADFFTCKSRRPAVNCTGARTLMAHPPALGLSPS